VFAPMPMTAVVMTMELPVMADVAVMVATDAVPAPLLAGLGVYLGISEGNACFCNEFTL